MARETAREDLSRFLSACFYEPTNDFAEAKLFDSINEVAAIVSPALVPLALRLKDSFAAESLEALLVDYTRLFLGPSRAIATPYESFWLSSDTTLMHEQALAILSLYEEGGFEVDEDLGDLPDHIAVELEFLYALSFKRKAAAMAGEQSEYAVLDAVRQRLLREHLARWIPRFSAAIVDGAQTEFYRTLAELTLTFLNQEVQQP